MINSIAFDSYEATLERDKAFCSPEPSSVCKTSQMPTLSPFTPSQRTSPPRCCNPLDTVYEYPLSFDTSPIITPSPERIFDGSEQRVWGPFPIDLDHHAGWYDGLGCTNMPLIFDARGPIAEGLLVYMTVTLCTPYSAMDWHCTRGQFLDTILGGVPPDQDSNQKNNTKQNNGGAHDKGQGQKDHKRKDQSHDQDQDQGTSQRGNTGSGQRRGRPLGSMNKCKYCQFHKLSKCIRNGPYPCSNCTIGNRDKRTCDGHGIEKPAKRGRGRPRTKCDYCYDLNKTEKCDRNQPTVNAVYPCSRCVRDGKLCLPLPAGYSISQVSDFEDENADTDESQAQAEERPRLHQSSLIKSNPYSPPAELNEAEADTLGTVLISHQISLPAGSIPHHWDGSKQSPTWQPLSTLSPSTVHSSSIPNETEDERLTAQPSTYYAQQCHNCIKYSDICDRYQPCSACTNNISRGKCVSAELPSWANLGLEGDLREEDNEKARRLEKRLRKFLG